jgi:GAF domain-containing protein
MTSVSSAGPPPPPPREVARRAAVEQVVGSARGSRGLQRLVRTAARELHVPVAMVSLITADRGLDDLAVGLPEPWATLRSTPLSHSLCAQVVRHDGPVVLFDARVDPAYRRHAAVLEMGAGAYAGYPLRVGGHVLGAFCAADFVPRQWSGDDLQRLEELAAQAGEQLGRRLTDRAGRPSG